MNEQQCREISKKLWAMWGVIATDRQVSLPNGFIGYVQELTSAITGVKGTVVIEPTTMNSGRRFNRSGYKSPKLQSVTVPVNKAPLLNEPNSWWMNISEDGSRFVLLKGEKILTSSRVLSLTPYNNQNKEYFFAIPLNEVQQDWIQLFPPGSK